MRNLIIYVAAFCLITQVCARDWKVYDESCSSNNDCASLNCANGKCKGGLGSANTRCDDNRVCRSLNCASQKCQPSGNLPAFATCDFNEACASQMCITGGRGCKSRKNKAFFQLEIIPL
jgi:hypothetical protein